MRVSGLPSASLILSSLLYFFSYPEVDPDLWGHLYFGREIIHSAKLPLENLYSYTAPHFSWINHEWLSEIIFYGVFHFLGSPGLILLKLVLGGGVVWILDRVVRQQTDSLLVRTLTAIWTMAILSPGFNIRPQLFTYLFFALFLFLFYRYDRGREATLSWVPLLMVLWVNLHGGFVAGLGALALFSLWISIRGLWDRDIKPIVVQVLLPCLASGVFLLLNPYGLDLLSFLARDLLLDRPITEWQSVPIADFSFLEFKVAALLVLVFFLRPRSLRRWDFVLALMTIILAFRHQRHTPLFAIAAAPFLAAGLQGLWDRGRGRVRGWILTVAVLALALYQIQWIGKIHLQHRFRLVVNPAEYPAQAADFMARNGMRGNLAVPFDWGEYFIWKLYPQVLVSIDGRYTTAYPMKVIEDHWDWMEGKKGWRELLERYPAEIAVTKREHPVTRLMRKDPEWIYIYSDPVAFIFVKKTSRQISLLKEFEAGRLIPPKSPSIYFPG